VQAGDITDVVVLAYAGTARQRRELQARRIADFGDPHPSAARILPFLWLLAMGIAAAWAEDADATDTWADALAHRTGGSWRAGATAWLRALARRARGEPVAGLLLATAHDGLPDLPPSKPSSGPPRTLRPRRATPMRPRRAAARSSR